MPRKECMMPCLIRMRSMIWIVRGNKAQTNTWSCKSYKMMMIIIINKMCCQCSMKIDNMYCRLRCV